MIDTPMTLFNDLLDLPRSAVYAVIDESRRMVLVTYSMALIPSLGRLVERIKNGESYCRNFVGSEGLKFEILDTGDCRNRLIIRTGFHMRKYKSLGYKLIVETPPAEYRVKCLPHYPMYDLQTRVVLRMYLVSKRNSKILVGEFRTQASYDEFYVLNYGIDGINDLIYHESVVDKT